MKVSTRPVLFCVVKEREMMIYELGGIIRRIILLFIYLQEKNIETGVWKVMGGTPIRAPDFLCPTVVTWMHCLLVNVGLQLEVEVMSWNSTAPIRHHRLLDSCWGNQYWWEFCTTKHNVNHLRKGIHRQPHNQMNLQVSYGETFCAFIKFMVWLIIIVHVTQYNGIDRSFFSLLF